MKSVSIAVASLGLAVQIAAQSQIYGYKDLTFPNRSGKGSSSLTTTVYYPATRTGKGVPIKPRVGGHPVIVWLHGFSVIGRDYFTLGSHFADKGYVVVLPNTARFLPLTQVDDALALFPALRVANTSGFLKGALNLDRIGLSGHSYGGSGTFDVLSRNPGYRCGLGVSPIDASSDIDKVSVPIGMIAAKGDWVISWRSNALRTYNAARNYPEFKFLYLMNSQCGHNNIVGILQFTKLDREAWARSARVIEGFFDKYLEEQPEGVEEIAGPTARASGLLDTLYLEVRTPAMWVTGTPEIGKPVRPSLLCEPGIAIIATALKTASIQLPFGLLQLDPATLLVLYQGPVSATRLLAPQLTIPNNPALHGARVPLQGLGPNNANGVSLSGLAVLNIR